jgi:hypothetical protein
MKWLIAFTCALFVASGTRGQSAYVGAMRQAQAVSTKVTDNNKKLLDSPQQQQQQLKSQPVDPVLQATLQNTEDLRSDFASIGNVSAASVPAAQISSLTNHLLVAAQGTKPQMASVAKLAGDLTTAIAGQTKLRASHPKLAQYVHASFNGAHLTAAQQQMILDSVQKILKEGGASAEETADVVGDLKTIAGETK